MNYHEERIDQTTNILYLCKVLWIGKYYYFLPAMQMKAKKIATLIDMFSAGIVIHELAFSLLDHSLLYIIYKWK